MAHNCKNSDEKFIEVVKNNVSIRNCLKALNLKETGGNYKFFYSRVERLKLDISHFTGKSFLKGKTHNWAKKIPLKNVLVPHSHYNSHTLKLRLIKENIKLHQCECCNNVIWNNKPIPLELEHINGVSTDNRLENLQLLCPNCHAQTDTYRGKNKGIKNNSSKLPS